MDADVSSSGGSMVLGACCKAERMVGVIVSKTMARIGTGIQYSRWFESSSHHSGSLSLTESVGLGNCRRCYYANSHVQSSRSSER